MLADYELNNANSCYSDTYVCGNFIFASPTKYEITTFCIHPRSRNQIRTQAGGQNAEKGSSS